MQVKIERNKITYSVPDFEIHSANLFSEIGYPRVSIGALYNAADCNVTTVPKMDSGLLRLFKALSEMSGHVGEMLFETSTHTLHLQDVLITKTERPYGIFFDLDAVTFREWKTSAYKTAKK